MSWTTRVTGEITITPPIPWNEVKDGPFAGAEGSREHRDVVLRLHEEEIDDGEWSMVLREAVAVTGTWEDSYRAYHVVEHLQELIDLYGRGREFTGRLEGEGPELDLWRLYVRDGRAVQVRPVITWPDESRPS